MAETKVKKDLLLDMTMRIVAEKGLLSFSMRQVTKAAGTSEALIYKHYETKENLLFQCFQQVDREIAALFTDETIPAISSSEESYAYIKGLWMKYFKFLIQNGYKTLYYFEYRDSPYIAAVKENAGLSADTYFKGFANVFKVLVRHYNLREKIRCDLLWTYILDVTGIFARRIIRGELPGGEQGCEAVWRLVFQGISGLL